ncbi:PHD finger protein 21B isoform X5 [Anser cygnoides]|uniref:PHD finger protein 21B isoform X5 n=1 Tax=Anser cygnoides TaxID=8845 RepID=UPI0034D18BA6
MELHSLQEALKVEIQCHQKLVAQMKQDPQNGDLKKQIHERQSRIAALNEKQKLTVRSRPAALLVGSGASGSAKPGGGDGGGGGVPALLKAPGGSGGSPGGSPAQNLAISVVPAKAPIAMVTAHLNGGLGGVEPPQSAPINLQTPARLAAARRPPELGSRTQTLGTITAVPIKVPQVSSLQRLAGQGPAVLPQVIIIQPQVQTQTESKVETKKLPEESAQGSPATKKKKEENPEKIAFMVALGLVTTEHLEEIQSKRQERKRRSTANPAYSGLLETERKRLASNYLNNPLFLSTRANEDQFWKNEIHHDEHCTACKRGINLQPCGACPRAYHLNCLDPPLKTAPKGVWVCPKCQQKVLKKDDNVPWTGTLAIVHSYVTHKTVKEEEKRQLLKRSSELKSEHRKLEEKDRLLNNAVKKCLELKSSLLAQQKGTQSSLERLKTLIRLIQNEQMIQVTMTTTTTSSLLTVPWIKPSSASAAMHKALQQSQGNN